ncbi:MAG: monovalent cation/H(+) antiporter subunit G [Clostridia bacterium]|nr:monovalent cation/H(+) antiporter subunit G [Clostridia bacterium]
MANIIAGFLVTAGIFFLIVGAIGLVRLPDFYTRLHAAGLCDTLGLLLTLAGLMVYQGLNLTSLKILIIAMFILLANPTATHTLFRAAYRAGLKPRGEG